MSGIDVAKVSKRLYDVTLENDAEAVRRNLSIHNDDEAHAHRTTGNEVSAHNMASQEVAYETMVSMMSLLNESRSANAYINQVLGKEYTRVSELATDSRKRVYMAQQAYMLTAAKLRSIQRSIRILFITVTVTTVLSALLGVWKDRVIGNILFVALCVVVFGVYTYFIVAVMSRDMFRTHADTSKLDYIVDEAERAKEDRKTKRESCFYDST